MAGARRLRGADWPRGHCWSLLDSPSRVSEGTRKKKLIGLKLQVFSFQAAQGSDPSKPVFFVVLVRGGDCWRVLAPVDSLRFCAPGCFDASSLFTLFRGLQLDSILVFQQA